MAAGRSIPGTCMGGLSGPWSPHPEYRPPDAILHRTYIHTLAAPCARSATSTIRASISTDLHFNPLVFDPGSCPRLLVAALIARWRPRRPSGEIFPLPEDGPGLPGDVSTWFMILRTAGCGAQPEFGSMSRSRHQRLLRLDARHRDPRCTSWYHHARTAGWGTRKLSREHTAENHRRSADQLRRDASAARNTACQTPISMRWRRERRDSTEPARLIPVLRPVPSSLHDRGPHAFALRARPSEAYVPASRPSPSAQPRCGSTAYVANGHLYGHHSPIRSRRRARTGSGSSPFQADVQVARFELRNQPSIPTPSIDDDPRAAAARRLPTESSSAWRWTLGTLAADHAFCCVSVLAAPPTASRLHRLSPSAWRGRPLRLSARLRAVVVRGSLLASCFDLTTPSARPCFERPAICYADV